MRALESKQMLQMSSFGTNTRTQTFAPLINYYCVIDDVLSHAMPHIDKTLLQFIQVMNLSGRPAAAFRPISCSPLVKIWTVGGHRSCSMNAGVSRSRSFIVLRARCAGALSCTLAARWRSLTRSSARQAVAVDWEAHHGSMCHWSSLQDRRISAASNRFIGILAHFWIKYW